MYQKKFVEAIKPLNTQDFNQLYKKMQKWVDRGKPVTVGRYQLFHNGDLTNYDTLYDLVVAVYRLGDRVNYCTCAICVKTFIKDR